MAITSFDLPFAAPPLPSSDLNPTVELYLKNTSAWLDVSNRVLYDSMTVQRGGPDESTTVTAATLSATINNADGALSTLNPLSPYYGDLGLNTPVRVSVPNGSTMLLSETDTASGVSTPSSSAINTAITDGGFEIWFDADLDNWWAPQVLVSKWAESVSHCCFLLRTDGQGSLTLVLSSNGTIGANLSWSVGVPLPIFHGRMSIRVSFVSSNGQAVFYYGPAGCTTWTLLGTVALGSSYPIFSTSSALQVGWCSDIATSGTVGAQGKIYAAAIVNTVGGSLSSIVAAADMTQQAAGTASWSDGLSNTWTVQGTAAVSSRNYRFYGESSAWPQSWSNGGANAYINLQASGLLRRQGQSNSPFNSVLYRAYTRNTSMGQTPIAYWPCEDLAGATQLASATPGGHPMTISGNLTLSSDNNFACSAPLPVTNGASVRGTVPAYTPGTSVLNGTIIRWLMDMSSAEATAAIIARFKFTGGSVGFIDFLNGGSSNSFYFNIYSTDGTLLTTSAWSQPIATPLWWSLEYTVTSSGHYQVAFANTSAGSGAEGAIMYGPVAGSVGAVASYTFNPVSTALTQYTAFGHVTVQSAYSSLYLGNPPNNAAGPLNAYDGELAGLRFQRLCSEEGVAFRSVGNLNDTQPMGIQTPETLAQLLQECVDADQGIWYEPRQCLGWGYRTRQSLANQTVAVTLDNNQDHLSETLEPTTDDQVIKNDVTITSQQGGSSARQTLDDGSPCSIGVIGRYDTEVTQNIDNQYLSVSAGWLLWYLTCGQPRYKSVSADLANTALAGLYYAILQLDIGDRINIVNPPVWLPPGAIDQLIKGAQEKISSKAFAMSWNTIPALPSNVIFSDDLVYGRADTATSRITNTITSTQTSFSVTTYGDVWTNSPGDFPFNIMVNGEEMTVTNITGSASPFTFTVTRGVNGVQVTAANGTYFYLYPSPIISL